MVSAASPNSPAPFFEFPSNDDVLLKIITTLDCMLDAIGNVIGNNKGLKSLFEEYRRKTQAAVQTDLKKCFKTNEDAFV